MNLLFVCRYNEIRSATAEEIYAAEGRSVKSAGTARSAVVPLSEELIIWADLIFVMEEKQRVTIITEFEKAVEARDIIVLDIPDHYSFMEPELVKIIRERVDPHLI